MDIPQINYPGDDDDSDEDDDDMSALGHSAINSKFAVQLKGIAESDEDESP